MSSSKISAIRWSAPLTASHVCKLIQAEPDVRKALLIFNSASAEYPSGYRHDHQTFAVIAARLAATGLARAAESILFRAFSELGDPPSESSFLPIIRSYSRAHLPLDALRLFRRMSSEFHLLPSHRSYNAVLAALVANSHLSIAKTLFNEMKTAGVSFTVASFNVLIKAFCSAQSAASGTLNSAIRIFRSMPMRGCSPDACTYNTLIDGLCRHGRVGDAKKLFEEMQQHDCSPTVVTFTSLMHGMCLSGNFDEALRLFDGMGKRGIKPNVITYTSLIDGLCKGGRSLEAMGFLERMMKHGCLANVITYSALINGLCAEGRLQQALEVLDKMRLQGRKPDAGLYGKLIKGLCESNRFHEAANYLDEMALSGISPNRLTWGLHVRIHNMVIRGLCSTGKLVRSFHVYLNTRNHGISIDPETYALLLDCYCKKGDVHKTVSICHEMMVEGCFPDYNAWHGVLEVHLGRRKVRKAIESIWDELVQSIGDIDVSESKYSQR